MDLPPRETREAAPDRDGRSLSILSVYRIIDNWISAMTTLEPKLMLPERLAQEAQAAGLLTPAAVETLLRDELKRRAGARLNESLRKVDEANSLPLAEQDIQTEINAVRLKCCKKHRVVISAASARVSEGRLANSARV